VYDAFALIQQMGISASALIQATTNEPTSATERDFQDRPAFSLRSRGLEKLVQPINDELRGLQRDALVD